jgi:ABC-type glycerol-3-phosphate transport system substrate-binding protein
LIDLSDMLPLANELETYQFVLDIGTYDGEVRAFSWQATPGAMFYRRSMAQQIFGTDDPDTIQNYFRDINTALNSARRIRDESGGSMFFTNHFDAFGSPFYANRNSRWIEDNQLVVDPAVLEYMDFARTVRSEGLDAQVGNWSPDWFASMADEFTDIEGNPLHIFSYMLPTWGLAHVVYANHGPDTFGDWAIIPGPLPYQWGGTWLGVPRAANNPDLGRLFIESFVLNPEVLANWALGVYTHEYLLQIDPNLHPGVFQGGGDFVSSARIVREITDQFDGSPIYHFLGGQNPYAIFGQAAPLVDLRLIQGTDSTIQGAFGEAVGLYIDGLATRDEALDFFRENVHMAMPWLSN